LKALADQTRRSILDLLRTGSHTVNDIAAHLPISQPAVSQHLAVLKAAGLVMVVTDGARRNYSLNDAGLIAVRAYIDSLWGSALESFREVANGAAGTASASDEHGGSPTARPRGDGNKKRRRNE